MRDDAPPTHVGTDHWPVLSCVRVTGTDDPGECVVLVSCCEGNTDKPYATLHVRVWPGRQAGRDGEYNLTFEQAADLGILGPVAASPWTDSRRVGWRIARLHDTHYATVVAFASRLGGVPAASPAPAADRDQSPQHGRRRRW
ncbi:hypothetical protein [Dactylosporangium sp. NPDC049140]|uniref:hypothetical protein n=1 Tax=Dactylosporangium sp. NPDC049140 TaxID=3155647 RepID=UPI0033D3390C